MQEHFSGFPEANQHQALLEVHRILMDQQTMAQDHFQEQLFLGGADFLSLGGLKKV